MGVVNFSQFASVIFLAPAAGNAADRFNRRRLVVVTQVSAEVLAASLAVITAAGAATPAIVIGIALALGVTLAVATPALQVIVPSLVTRDEMPAAGALNAVSLNLSRAIGPVTAALVTRPEHSKQTAR